MGKVGKWVPLFRGDEMSTSTASGRATGGAHALAAGTHPVSGAVHSPNTSGLAEGNLARDWRRNPPSLPRQSCAKGCRRNRETSARQTLRRCPDVCPLCRVGCHTPSVWARQAKAKAPCWASCHVQDVHRGSFSQRAWQPDVFPVRPSRVTPGTLAVMLPLGSALASPSTPFTPGLGAENPVMPGACSHCSPASSTPSETSGCSPGNAAMVSPLSPALRSSGREKGCVPPRSTIWHGATESACSALNARQAPSARYAVWNGRAAVPGPSSSPVEKST
mmetsp:Transcript_10511/g.40875  ORF Transcript_10511/g.40875 Transcript_10511/m.40875 type:complete len:277 (+) Transcript_10511:1707-2537(+)